MSEPGNTLPLPVRRQLELKCERCELPALPGRRLCQGHLEDKRRRQRASIKRRRDARRKKRRCIDCGKKCQKRRCRECWIDSRGSRPKRAGVDQSDGNWRADPGTNWVRFRGKGRRGRLTREEQIDEDARDAGFAITEIRKFVEALDVLKRPEMLNLPPIQRDAARREVGQYLGLAGRIIDELADKYG